MQSLDVKQQGLLLKLSPNSDPSKTPVDSTAVPGPRAPPLNRSATSAHRGPSLKETIAAKKKEARLAERPESAQSLASPTRPILPRPATSMAIGSLSSAPLRPIRTKLPPKKVNSPSVSPLKSKPRMVIPELAASQHEKDRPRSSPSKPVIHRENIPPRKAALGKTVIETGNQSAHSRASPPSPCAAVESKPDVPHTELPKRVIIYKDSASSPSANIKESVNDSKADSQQSKTTPTKDAENMTLVLPILANTFTVDSSKSPMSPSTILGSTESESGQSAKSITIDEPVLGLNNSETPRLILSELPLNHETSSKSTAVAPNTVVSPNLTQSQSLADLKIIQSGIARIKSQTLDAHGFRRLQKLIQHRQTFWTEDPAIASQYHLQDLFSALLGALQHKDDLKMRTHLLKTIRLMATFFPTTLRDRAASAVSVLLRTKVSYPPQSHLADEHRCTVSSLLKLTARGEYTTFGMKQLIHPVENPETFEANEIEMNLRCLCGLMHLDNGRNPHDRHPLDREWQFRLAKALLVLIDSEDPALRKHSMACLMELNVMAGRPELFWMLLEDVSAENRSLIHYFLAMRRGGLDAEEAESVMIDFYGAELMNCC